MGARRLSSHAECCLRARQPIIHTTAVNISLQAVATEGLNDIVQVYARRRLRIICGDEITYDAALGDRIAGFDAAARQ